MKQLILLVAPLALLLTSCTKSEEKKEIQTSGNPIAEGWYMVYHRRPIPNEGRDHRVTCIDSLKFNEDGTIKPVKMTFEGVVANPIKR